MSIGLLMGMPMLLLCAAVPPRQTQHVNCVLHIEDGLI